MAPTGVGNDLSARRAQFAGPTGIKGLIHTKKTSSIAVFAALGGFVYGCPCPLLPPETSAMVFANA